MSTKIGVIDYGSGNFTSVMNAFTAITDRAVPIVKPGDFGQCSHLVLPGVGAFKAAMDKIEAQNLLDAMYEEVFTRQKPFLGICVGMQVMAEKGFEFEEADGLGWIPADVVKFDNSSGDLRLPHMGWNDVLDWERNELFRNIRDDDPSFYFVHSYHLLVKPGVSNLKTVCSDYGYKFIAAVQRDNIFGVQFHPEKSQSNGLQLLRNFIELNG